MTEPATHHATILYVEDDDASRNLIQRVLSHAGYRVLVASRALDGIDLAHQFRPDLILLDISLPDMSGREIAIRLRSDPQLAAVPIVALTAQSQPFERDKTFTAGFTGYLTKPVDVSTLTSKIADYLHGQHDEAGTADLKPAEQAYKEEVVRRLEATVRELESTNRDLHRLDEIKEGFIQLTAHELRTPLTTVYGYSRLVQTSAAIQALMAQDPEVEACVQGLADSVERLNIVINEIVTVSRIASGQFELKLGPADLRSVIKSAVDDYAQVIKQRNLKVTYEAKEWPSQFFADVALLELAFSNILGNAIKYTPDDKSITLHVHVKEALVHIRVKDTGIGIDPKDQPLIFDRFYTTGDTQLHSTSKTAFRGGGLGLGLAICRGIVEAHGGKIWVESEGCDEKRCPGSTFFIELPLRFSPPGQLRRSYL